MSPSPPSFFVLTGISSDCAVTVIIDGSGTADVTGIEDGYTFVGETVTVTATPDEGWTFAYWTNESGKIVSYDAEYTFEVEGDVTLTAVCVEDDAQPPETQGKAEFQSVEPRKETDPIIVPDNDEESDNPDGDGGDDGGDLPDGVDLQGGNGGEDAGRMTPQEAIATLNNLLAMCGAVRG